MAATIKYIRARKGCTRGIHVHYDRPADSRTLEQGISIQHNPPKPKALAGSWTLLDSVRYKWTGYLPWAGSYTETREQGLLGWWLKKKARLQAEYRKKGERHDSTRLLKKNKKSIRTTGANKHGRKRNTSVKQRTKKVVKQQKRSNKRKKTRTI